MIDRIRHFYDKASEPLRRRLHAALAALVLLAGTSGYLTSEVEIALTGVITAILAIPAVENARKRVSPTPIYDEPGAHAADRTTGPS